MKSTVTKKPRVKKSNKATKSLMQNPVINIAIAEGLSDADLKKLRNEIEYPLTHPDYVMISNYAILWVQIKINKKAKMRFVWAEDINAAEIEALGKQIDKAMADPNYVIVTNHVVHWEEIA